MVGKKYLNLQEKSKNCRFYNKSSIDKLFCIFNYWNNGKIKIFL